MSLPNRKVISQVIRTTTVLPTAVISIGLAMSAPIAHATITSPDEVIVTARRTEEVIQNVPISMTVFNQDMLDERNVVNAADLVKYTPSLNVNQRFGSDQASFAIRGFTQEFRTTASVAVYFADVVAPRGGASITAGDGAGPGAFFDLQNVQVLKGPQGTLFGRNTTGGAIQLVPKEPTSKLEGYLELSAGNYDMKRAQGVINVPLTDSARARFGVDTMKRDGYIKNISGIGPDHFSDVDYQAARASLIVDVTDTIQNYTILNYTHSENNGTIQGMFACDPNGLMKDLCGATMASQKGDFYSVASDTPNPVSKLQQWQIINTTTWDVSPDWSVKNIISFADLDQTMRGPNFGTDFIIPATLYGIAQNPALVGSHLLMSPSYTYGGTPTNSQTTFVEELQFSGTALDDNLTWQGGLYYENSRPDGWSGTMTPTFMVCPQNPGGDPAAWQCIDPVFGSGYTTVNLSKIEYLNTAAYAQTTYDITDEWRVTTGLRYTVDKTDGTNSQTLYDGFPTLPPAGAPTTKDCIISTASTPDCKQHLKDTSEAPTWLIDFDYLPTPDLMLYAKYARGYRQGSLNPFGPEGVQKFNPEKVDAYELGSKWSFRGPVPGTLNLALFYNKLKDQQIQVGYGTTQAITTTGIVNAGSSTIQGGELETTLQLYEGLMFSLSYTYLDTKLDKFELPQIDPNSPYQNVVGFAESGDQLTFSPHHTGTAALNYRLPLAVDFGDISIGASYTYVSQQLSIKGTYGMLDPRELVNLNANWRGVMGSGFDLALFATNVTNQKYPVNVTGLYDSQGMDFRVTGEPRMYGARVKYNF